MSLAPSQRTGMSTAKGQAAQRRVIDEALVLFQKRGYLATSIREIAEAAGLAKATVYHHYPTKAAILFEIHSIFMRTLEEGMTTIQSSDAGPQERMRAIIHELWRVMVTHRPHVQIFFEEWRHLDAEHIMDLKRRRDRYFGFVRDTVAEVWPEGDNDDTSRARVDVVTLGIFGMCNWGYQWFNPDGPLPAETIADEYADLMITALAGGGGPS